MVYTILFILVFSVGLQSAQGERYLIPKNQILHGQFKRAFKILLNYNEFNSIYNNKQLVKNYDYYILLLIASYRSDELDITQKVLNGLKKMFSDDVDLNYIQGQVLLKQGHPGKALNFFKLTLSLNPTYKYAHYGQIESYLSLKDYRKALAICNYCIEVIDREDPQIYFLKARSFEGLHKWKSAFRNMQIVINNSEMHGYMYKKRDFFENFYHKIK
ncbi:hypothetical protein KAJ27_12730 [bacterium]|nr:hypothetical protein [bacterium]